MSRNNMALQSRCFYKYFAAHSVHWYFFLVRKRYQCTECDVVFKKAAIIFLERKRYQCIESGNAYYEAFKMVSRLECFKYVLQV